MTLWRDEKMKKREQMNKHLAMESGNVSRDGFLGTDQRQTMEIIRADDEALKKLNLSHGAVAVQMSFFLQAGKKGLGEFVPVTPHFEVSCDVARGFLPCPFGDAGRHRKAVVTVRNLRLRKEITFSELNIHLIAAHGFYEGKGAPFRLEPTELIKVLEISPY